MSQKRSTEIKSNPPDFTHRTSRGYEINGQWYFELRGGGQKGPYESELSMRADLNDFVQMHEQMKQKV